MKKTLLPILLFSLLMQTGYAQEVIRIGFVQAGMLCGDASLAWRQGPFSGSILVHTLLGVESPPRPEKARFR